MRIIAGSMKGRKILAPPGSDTRPTSDRVREAVFSRIEALWGPLSGVDVLDAFAGSGALSFEALSRGAEHAVLFEKDPHALRTAKENSNALGLTDRCTIVGRDILKASSRGILRSRSLALMFLDPPYRIDKSEVRTLLQDLVQEGVLAEDVCVVWEHPSGDTVDELEGFVSRGSRKYGSTEVTFLIREGSVGLG